MTALIIVLLLISVSAVALVVYLFTVNKQLQKQFKDKTFQELSEEEAISMASLKAKTIIAKAKKEALELKTEAEDKSKNIYQKLEEKEKRLDSEEKRLNDKKLEIAKREKQVEEEEEKVERGYKQIGEMRKSLNQKLQKVAGMSRDEAKKKLFEEIEKELKGDIAKRIKESELEIQRESEEKAKWILVDAMQKAATDYIAETTTTTLELSSEEIKGKIIGKEGRNIRTFEKLTGVDIIVDESPEEVTLSCFDPVRREVAAISLQRLLKDGRIHPGTIEATINKVKEEIGLEIKKTGEKLAYDVGFPDLPIEIIRLLGRFKYRYSYGQNLIKHTMEMVKFGAALAGELNADVELVKKACLLHDVGKVLVHEVEGKPHHFISGEIIRRYLNDEKLANAAEAHHGDIEAKSIEAVIVAIADAVSGGRPGARRDNYDEYVKRIRALEDIATKFKGVKEAYAIHAGREVRVILKPEETSDDDAVIIASKIRKEIEKTQPHYGIVKITVIREFRKEEEAKK